MAQISKLLEGVAFRRPEHAQRNLIQLDPYLDSRSSEILNTLLRQSPDPDSALNYLERYLTEGEARRLPSGSRLHALLAVFAHSHFLSETLFQQPEWLEWAMQPALLHRVLSAEDLRESLRPAAETEIDLARFKRRHLLRIVLRDVLGLATLAEVTLELSTLADTLIEAALDGAFQQLQAIHGTPQLDPGGDGEFAVLALGKLGGQELNYSSDIDLMYLFTGAGQTSGPRQISNREFAIKLAAQLTARLSTSTPAGFCYRVDLRLRPEGSLGEMALPLDAAFDYYERRARDWELQMLIKARPAAGSRALGRRFLDRVEPLIYKTTTDFSAVESVSETRQRIHEKLRRKAPAGLNLKLGRGGIRDIEFLVQCLQRLYGGRDLWVRHGGTQFAMHRLRDKGYLGAGDYARLNTAYHFLRTLEHRLQIGHDRQTHTLPQDEEALGVLAAKMAVGPASPGSSGTLLEQTERHLRQVGEIYDRLIHGHTATAPPPGETSALFELRMESGEEPAELSLQAQLRYLEMRAPRVAACAGAVTLNRGRGRFEHFLGKVIAAPGQLAALEEKPEVIAPAADLFEHSPYFADALIRNPEEILELVEVAHFAPSDRQGTLFAAGPERHWIEDHPELEHLIRTRAPRVEKSAWLRRFYRRQMLRIQAASVCRHSPIFATLDQTTELADWVIRATYHVALGELLELEPESRRRRLLDHPLHVVALGRLGMREFDLGSDADLVFILPDQAQDEIGFWTRLAERMIEVLTSYTGEGVIFAVDTRLRPLGREGELVQTEGRYKQYFAEEAQAWEAITYMKSRCLAGQIDQGTAFLTDLQNVDWRRYGQSGTLAKLLADMRRKLEREQGREQPLKAGPGGYYDIDFVLMFLRLRGAGIFYRSLNTPERIEVIERMGWLTRDNAEFLRNAAIFYRALDHGMRVASGRSQGELPASRSQLDTLGELAPRWTPPSLHGRPIDELLAEMQRQTRALFDQIFSKG